MFRKSLVAVFFVLFTLPSFGMNLGETESNEGKKKSAEEILAPYIPMVKMNFHGYEDPNENDLTVSLKALCIYVASLGHYDEKTAIKILGKPAGDYFRPEFLYESQKDKAFVGVCDDYANRMEVFISEYEDYFIERGMYTYQPDPELMPKLRYSNYCYVCSSEDIENVMELKSFKALAGVGHREKRSLIFNWYKQSITPHEDGKGRPAKNHAWIWVWKDLNTVYWFDPTWTDNTGKIRWGYVDFDAKKEIALDGYVDFLNFKKEEKIKAEKDAESEKPEKLEYNRNLNFGGDNEMSSNQKVVFSVGYTLGTFEEWKTANFFSPDRLGFSVAVETPAKEKSWLGIGTVDYYRTNTKGLVQNSFLLGGDFGYSADTHFGIFLGGGLGVKFNEFDQFAESVAFAWKVNGGLRLSFSRFYLRTDLSCGTILGPALFCNIGWAF